MSRLRLFVWLLLLAHLGVLLWVAAHLPIGPHEAKLFFTGDTLVARLMHWGVTCFPDAEFLSIRIPFLVLHLINLYLFYRLCQALLNDETEVLTAFVTFLLLPGIVSSAVLATSTGLILALYQAFLLLYIKKREWLAYLVLPLMLYVDKSSVVFFFAMLTFALWRRNIPLLAASVTLFAAAVAMYGIEVHGKPKNYFVDTVALYAAIFSPLLFLYFFYAMYRILLKGQRTILWHIAFTILLLSLLLSMRQKIPIQDFAPYVVVAIPLMVHLFFRSYRVRLPEYRKPYRLAAVAVYAVLVLNTAILVFHRPLFLVLDNPQKHFAAPFYLPYWCAQALKERGIAAVTTRDGKLAYQLRFYGIEPNGGYSLSKKPAPGARSVTIRYKGRSIATCYVSKINN
ncbi:hypothetical protein [Hydrogenimonas sp.]